MSDQSDRQREAVLLDRKQVCERKQFHAEKWRAEIALKHSKHRDSLHVYECPYCHGWHLGGMSKRGRQ